MKLMRGKAECGKKSKAADRQFSEARQRRLKLEANTI
jgi:hypothetical protein